MVYCSTAPVVLWRTKHVLDYDGTTACPSSLCMCTLACLTRTSYSVQAYNLDPGTLAKNINATRLSWCCSTSYHTMEYKYSYSSSD